MIAGESRRLGINRRVIDDTEILDRCLAALINEGARVLDEGIALRPGDIDIVYVHGFGFPAWRGGPMHYADPVGVGRLLADVRRVQERLGEPGVAAAVLRRLALVPK